MREILDFDPLTGVSTVFDCDGQTMTISSVQDVEPYLKVAAGLRSDSDRTKKGIKNDWVHYAIIPHAIELEMKFKHGVDINKKEDHAKVYKLLNTEYSRFKTTDIVHNVRNGG